MQALLKSPSRQPDQVWSDRRLFPRNETRGRVLGRRLDHTLTARLQPRLFLSLRDLSLGGLSALIDQPLDAGEHMGIFFPPQGRQSGWDAFGRVIRCEPSATGFRVAIEFDPLPAA